MKENNDNNKKVWIRIMEHDYMDLCPTYSYELFSTMEEAENWAKSMRENYSGGTTSIDGYATQEEILKYIEDFKDYLDDITMKNIYNEDYYNVNN